MAGSEPGALSMLTQEAMAGEVDWKSWEIIQWGGPPQAMAQAQTMRDRRTDSKHLGAFPVEIRESASIYIFNLCP